MNEVKGTHSIEICYSAQFVRSLDDVKLETADYMGSGS